MTIPNHTIPVRLNRSQLAVPGSQPRFFEKARVSAADIIMLDLQDSVAPEDKVQARRNIIEVVNDLDWSQKTVSLRINAVDTHFMYRDLVDVIEQAGDRIDLVMVPGVDDAETVHMVDRLLTQIEAAKGFSGRIGLELQIETALGLQNIREIAAASKRAESLHFGPGDFAASMHARTTEIGGQNPDYPGDMWHHVLFQIVAASRAAGLRPIDGPVANFKDPDAFAQSAKRAAALGFDGKWAIHPSQIEMANEIMGPDMAQVEEARAILGAMEEAAREGRGAVTLNGKMIDYASVRQAEMLVRKAELIAR